MVLFWRQPYLFLYFSRDVLDISPTLTEAAGAIVDVSQYAKISIIF